MTIQKTPVPKSGIYVKYIKRILDFVLSLLAIIVLSPVFLMIYIGELIFHGRPALYVSKRPGKDGKLFRLYKFRSMTNKKDENGKLLPEDKRLTRFGRLLRRTSLDELPELYCILRGDMSIIGPRPLLPEYLDLYSERHKMRHSIRPGLACTKIDRKSNRESNRARTWAEQFENDIYYIENVNFFLDVRMIWTVLIAAIKGCSFRTDDTRVRFDGMNLTETRTKKELA